MKIVKIHCGNGHVRGKARRYRYFVASVFVTKSTKDGRTIWVNSGTSTTPRRSDRLAREDGLELATQEGAIFVEGYGSLHNSSCRM